MKVRKVSCSSMYQFYRYWLEVVCLKVNLSDNDGEDEIEFPSGRQHHILTSKQMDLLAHIMCNRRQLQEEKGINDDDVLDQLTTNDSGRTKIRLQMGITSQRMYELLQNMEKRKDVIIRINFDNGKLDYYRINPSLVPDIANKNSLNAISEIMVRFFKTEKEESK